MYRAIVGITFFVLSMNAQTVVESIVAKVDDVVILYSDVLQEGALLNLENGLPIQTPLSPDFKQKVLDSLIARAILLGEARDRGLSVSEQMVSDMVTTYEKLPYLSEFLKRFELTSGEFRILVKRRLLARLACDDYLSRFFSGRPTPTEEEKRQAAEKWIETLRKKHRILYYSLP